MRVILEIIGNHKRIRENQSKTSSSTGIAVHGKAHVYILLKIT